MKVSAKPLSRKDIRGFAKYIRKQLGMENEPLFPIVHVIEILAFDKEVDFDFDVVPDSVLDSEYGNTNTSENVMIIRESVYKGAVLGNPRDRFTLCHELGHWLLHQPDRVSFARGTIPQYCNPEWQANVFAAELMVPHYLVKGLSIERVMSECGVSRSCAKIQLACYAKSLT